MKRKTTTINSTKLKKTSKKPETKLKQDTNPQKEHKQLSP